MFDALDCCFIKVAACLRGQPPDEHQARDGLDETVHAEADKRDAAGGKPSADGNQPLDDVPPDGHVLEPQAASQQGCARRGGHAWPTSSSRRRSEVSSWNVECSMSKSPDRQRHNSSRTAAPSAPGSRVTCADTT